MKIQEVMEEIEKLDENTPVKFWHPDTNGDFYIVNDDEVIFISNRGLTVFYQWTVKDFTRDDWQMSAR